MPQLDDVAHVLQNLDNVALRRQLRELQTELDVWRRFPMIWLDHPSEMSDIPDHDAAVTMVIFGTRIPSPDLTQAERAALHASFQSVAGALSTQVVWRPREVGKVASFELPCSVLRRWLSADRNIWTYLPAFREVEDTSVWFVLSDEHDQPEEATDFSLTVCHNYPSNAFLE